jgi:hypothetical protein
MSPTPPIVATLELVLYVSFGGAVVSALVAVVAAYLGRRQKQREQEQGATAQAQEKGETTAPG